MISSCPLTVGGLYVDFGRGVAVYRFRVVPVDVSHRLRVVILSLIAALVLSGAVSAGASGHYKGKTKQGLSVSLRVSGSSVTAFSLSGDAICISASKSASEFYALKAAKAGVLKGGGRFTISYVKNTTHVQVSGRVSGSSASGSVNVHYTKLWLAGTSSEAATCWLKTTWSAKTTG